jgi:hypothetical protein
MLYTDLEKTGTTLINAGTEYIVYFNVETADEPSDHGTGGKTVLVGSEYTGTVHVTVNGRAAGSGLIVQTRHEDTSGVAQELTSSTYVPTYNASMTVAVPVTGTVPADRRLTIVLFNGNTDYISVSNVRLQLLSQAV